MNKVFVCLFVCLSLIGLGQNPPCSQAHIGVNLTCDETFWDMPDPAGDFWVYLRFDNINHQFITNTDAEFLINEIQPYFTPHRIFFYWDCEVNIIPNDTSFGNNNRDAIDIMTYTNGSPQAKALNIGSTQLDFDSYQYMLDSPQTLAHEIGHCLGLLHTHNGYHNDTDNDNPCTCDELPGEETGDLCGDCISDTPPDFNLDNLNANDWLNCEYVGNEDLGDYVINVRNLMSYGPFDCKDHFTPGQGKRMRQAIAYSEALAGCSGRIGESNITNSTFISSTLSNNGIKRYWGDVNIKSGGALTASVDIEFLAEGSKINVEKGGALFLTGNTTKPVTIKGSCQKNWGGIRVQGDGFEQTNNDPGNMDPLKNGFVKLNNVILENTTTAISQAKAPFGGLIECDNVTFQNCDRGVEMMRFDGDDLSYFRGCTFNTDRYGMSIWRNNDVEISNCEFNDSDYGILTVNSSVQVSDNCRFNGCNEYGIRLQGTHPNGLNIPSNIKDSYFSNDGTDIKMTGVTSSQRAEITNNNFIGTPAAATWMDGDNYYDIANNTFDGSAFTNIVYSTGELENRHDNNLISSNAYGILAMYANSGYQFERNCFESSRNADVFVYGGEISSQGTEDLANGNCFTESSATKDIDTNLNNSFVYFHTEQGVSPECETPINTANYTTDISFSSKGNEGCGSSVQPPSPPQVELCKPKKDIDSVKAAIKEIKPMVRELRSMVQVEKDKPEIIKAELDEKEQCLRKLILLLSSLLEDKNIDEAIRVLQQEPEFRYHIMAYGLMIRTGRLSEAQSYLRAMRPSTEEEQDFVYVQHIVIRDIIQGRKGFLNDTESSRTYAIAQKNDPLAAYARALWYWYTEEDIELALPRIMGEEFVKPRNNSEQENISWKIYPNPSRGTIHIAVDNLQIEIQTVNRVSIMDITGKLRYEEEIDLSDVQRLDIDLASGVYLLTISSGEAMLHSQRLVISN